MTFVRKNLLGACAAGSLSGGCRNCTARINSGTGRDRHPAANGTWDTHRLGFDHFTRHAAGLCHHLGLTDLTASRVRHLTGFHFTSHRAGCVRDPLGDAFRRPRAGGVRHSLGDALGCPRAGRVRHPLRACFANHRAGGVRNSLRHAFLFPANAGVRNLLHRLHRHPAADSVRLLAGLCLTDIRRAGDLLANLAGNPCSLAAGCWWALLANHPGTTGTINTLAGTRIPFPCPGILHALLHHLAGDLISLSDPFASALFHSFVGRDRLADGVADIAIAGFSLCPISGAADLTIVRFADRLLDCAGHIAIARLEHRTALGVADVAIAGLVDRLLDCAGHVAIARLVNRLLDRAGHFPVASLINRLAHGVTFFTIAGLADRTGAGHWHLASHLIVHRAAALVLLRIPNRFLNSLVARGGAGLGGAVIASRGTCLSRTAAIPCGTAVFCFGNICQSEGQQASQSDHHGRNFHRSILVPVRTA